MNERRVTTLRPGERLIQLMWLEALRAGGSIPMPTLDRINTVKKLAFEWQASDAEARSDAG